MPLMTRVPSDLAKFGLTVELVPGWETRSAGSFAPAGVTCHWTAGPKDAKGRPSLNVVVNGRAGLPGPLCNVYLGRDGTCIVVAAGRANHAGEGGYKGLVGNSAVYGIEAECAGDGDWTPAQKKVYPRLVAALLHGLGRDASWSMGHNEWAPTRKIDIRDIMPEVRSGAAAILTGSAPSEEDELMAAADDILAKLDDLAARVGGVQYMTIPKGGWTGEEGAVIGRIGGMQAVLAQILGIVSKGADVDEKALAAELAPVIAPMLADILKSDLSVDGLTPEELADAVDEGLRRVLGSLDAA